MADGLRLYHALPYPLKVLAASARGYHLRGWRYGADHEQLVEAALERESWPPERWQTWQEERLAYVLHRAATRVPYYRRMWAKRRRKGQRASWEYLENWPVLEKEPLRAHPRAFLADDCHPRAMFHEHTSGTTGKSLDLWWSRETVRAWYALAEARSRRWYGVSRRDRWAMLGGQLVAAAARARPPFWVWNHGLNQLYLSVYHLSPELIPAYVDALVRYRVRYLWGYPSALYALAREVLRLGWVDVEMQVAVANAEPVYEHQRQTVERAFHSPLRETYGMAEIVAAASECGHGGLHLWPEVGVVEVLAGRDPLPRGQAGDLVCTGLLNADMPLIRYRVGDRGALAAAEGCACGRGLPLLAAVEGRQDDVLYTPDGRAVGRLDPVFKARLPVIEAQIIQEALERVRVRYVPAADYTPDAGRSIIERLQARMDGVQVVLEPVSRIPREPNGKFRAVVSRLSADERARVRAGIRR